ncbi:MAG: ABC transporter substrate-binding protein [Rhodospirillales bacterium]
MKKQQKIDLEVSFKYVVALTMVLTAVIVTSPAFSQQAPDVLAPDALVKSISTDVAAAIKRDPAIQAGDPRRIAELAETKVVPCFDFRRMTMSAMAKNWRTATPEQQEQLTREFKTLLVSTYSRALASYRDQEIAFRSPRANDAQGSEVTVRSEIKLAGQAPTVVDYDLAKTPTGWRIFDVKVGGVSLVAAYRDNFADEVRNKGIDGLIASLAGKNRANEARFRATSA